MSARIRLAATIAGSVLVACTLAITGFALTAARSATPSAMGPAIPVAVSVPIAPAAPPPSAPVLVAADPLQGWAQQQWQRTGVPVPALRAYGRAELRLATEQPGCRLGWVTLAGIGAVESDHGRYDGRSLGEDGRSSAPVVGIALDGVGVARVADTDRGALDGDPTLDRAVGPMQVIPSTWRRWASDGDGDGRSDPQDIDDAALAAARYLCASGRLSSDVGWRAAVLSYNASTPYLLDVAAWANAYARASAGQQ